MTHNQNTQPMQCHYAVSKEYINTISTSTKVDSPHFPIYLQIKDNYFRVQLKNDLYLPVSLHEFKNKAQPLGRITHNKTHQMCTSTNPESPYPIIQHAVFTLNINRTEPYTNLSTNANYAELINQINFSLPALDDFIPSSPKIYNYFYHQNTILDNTILYQAQQQDPVIRQLILWKTYKNHPLCHHFQSALTKNYYTITDASYTYTLMKRITFYITYKKPTHQKFVYHFHYF